MVLQLSCYSRGYQSVMHELPMVQEIQSGGQQNRYTSHIKEFIPSVVLYCIIVVKYKAENNSVVSLDSQQFSLCHTINSHESYTVLVQAKTKNLCSCHMVLQLSPTPRHPAPFHQVNDESYLQCTVNYFILSSHFSSCLMPIFC